MQKRLAIFTAAAIAVGGLLLAPGCGAEPNPPADAGHDHDAGSTTQDAGATDAGSNDAGTMDAGTHDAGTMDAGMIDAGAPVSFASDIVPLFSGPPGNCTGCHLGTASGGLDLGGTAAQIHARLVNVAATSPNCKTLDRIEPNQPDQSFLYLKVTRTQPANCGTAMPAPNGLPGAESDLIRRWIEQGAPNN